MNNEDLQRTMDLWHQLQTNSMRPVETNSAEESLAVRRTRWASLVDQAQPWLLPPAEGLTGQTRDIVRQWQHSWSKDLKASPLWQTVKADLDSIRNLIASGNLDDADWQIRDIFVRCVPAVRKLGVSGFGIRAVTSDSLRQDKATEIDAVEEQVLAADSLIGLVSWLERL